MLIHVSLFSDLRYSIDRSTDKGRRFTVNSDCEVKVKRGLDGETLDREALAGLPEEKYEVHVLAKDKGNVLVHHIMCLSMF